MKQACILLTGVKPSNPQTGLVTKSTVLLWKCEKAVLLSGVEPSQVSEIEYCLVLSFLLYFSVFVTNFFVIMFEIWSFRNLKCSNFSLSYGMKAQAI